MPIEFRLKQGKPIVGYRGLNGLWIVPWPRLSERRESGPLEKERFAYGSQYEPSGGGRK